MNAGDVLGRASEGAPDRYVESVERTLQRSAWNLERVESRVVQFPGHGEQRVVVVTTNARDDLRGAQRNTRVDGDSALEKALLLQSPERGDGAAEAE